MVAATLLCFKKIFAIFGRNYTICWHGYNKNTLAFCLELSPAKKQWRNHEPSPVIEKPYPKATAARRHSSTGIP